MSLAFLLVVAGLIFGKGNVRGTEFSPTHFQLREFDFYELPGFQWQLTPIRRTAVVQDTAVYLRQKSLVDVPTGSPDRWDLVDIWRGSTRSTDDASLVTGVLEIPGQKDAYWQEWSADHPPLAAVLWPIIQTLARRELYVWIPDVFHLADAYTADSDMADSNMGDSATNHPQAFRQRIRDHLDQQYESMIRDLRQSDMQTAADELARQYALAPLVDPVSVADPQTPKNIKTMDQANPSSP